MAVNKKFLRLVDANLNRCREGLRVVEDTARFILDEEKLYKELRSLRHTVDAATRAIYPQLLAQRDAHSDAGRTLKEGKRESIAAIVFANFRRIEESLRVLEEYSRVLAPRQGPVFKAIRYKVYCLEKAVVVTGKRKK